jgi:hypothetical protein
MLTRAPGEVNGVVSTMFSGKELLGIVFVNMSSAISIHTSLNDFMGA